MFYIFSENVIKITKGNSAVIDITLVDSDTQEHIELSEGDRILFTVKNQGDRTVIQKVITNADLLSGETDVYACAIDPEDTAKLPIGDYDYDCLLLLSDGQAITFISSKLVITKAVGLYTDVVNGGGEE